MLNPLLQSKAARFRRLSGSSELEKTLVKLTNTLGEAGIPCLVVGGFALQEYGYARFTEDIDILVPDVQSVREYLSIRGFKLNPGSSMTITDRNNQVEVDVLPGGGRVDRGPLALPVPQEVSLSPILASMKQIIEMKLSTFLSHPGKMGKHRVDVGELILRNRLPLEFDVDSRVREEYQKVWSDVNSDPESETHTV